MGKYETYRPVYEDNWTNLKIRPSREPAASKAAKRITAGKPRYQKVEKSTSVPWWFVGLVHLRESDLDFTKQLGQGDPLDQVSTHEPKGMGPYRGPSAFEDSCVDALKHEGYLNQPDWSVARTCYRLEGYNGYGYHSHGVNSPYLYGGSTLYGPPEARAGKYVKDGVFSDSFNDPQLGTLVVLKKMMEGDPSIQFKSPPTMPPSSVAKHGTAGSIIVAGGVAAGTAAQSGMRGPVILAIIALTIIVAAAAWFGIHNLQKGKSS